MNNTSRLWKVLGALLVVSFGILLFMGRGIYLAVNKSAALTSSRQAWSTTLA
jgi:nitric oxide reductase large subunit